MTLLLPDVDIADDILFQGEFGLRARYHERYAEQQRALSRLCTELGLYQIDIATDADMLAELKTGLGLRLR